MAAASAWTPVWLYAAVLAAVVSAAGGAPPVVDPNAHPPIDVESQRGVVYVDCESTEGPFSVEVHPEWSPLGAKRYLELVRAGYYDGVGLFRVVKKFLVQFGAAADPKDMRWTRFAVNIDDDPNLKIPILKGYMSFAGGGADSRQTQVFIAYDYHRHLGMAPWETPFGRVVQGMENVDRWNGEYGDITAFNPTGVDTGRLSREGNAYLKTSFPRLSYITTCRVRGEDTVPPPSGAEPVPSAPKPVDPKVLIHVGAALVGAVVLMVCWSIRQRIQGLCFGHAKDT